MPIVEAGVRKAENIYETLKHSNSLLNWSFLTAESVVWAAVDSVRPAARLLEGPIQRIDQVVSHGIDMIEQRVPSVYLPPEMIYFNTKEYVGDHFVRPVLKRADSVKQLGTVVLDSRVTTYAADRLEGAIDVADKYVERYLPPKDSVDEVDHDVADDDDDAEERKAIHAYHKGRRFSKKLKRRLTIRTVAEARALTKQSKEAIHVLVYVAELIATDPKLALKKGGELWGYLSGDEPENQHRPENLEQLIVLLTRESARRMVHLLNFIGKSTAKIPKSLKSTITDLAHQLYYSTKSLSIQSIFDQKNKLQQRSLSFYGNLQKLTSTELERLAIYISGRLDAEKQSVNGYQNRSTSQQVKATA